MKDFEEKSLHDLIVKSLDDAESIWNKKGKYLTAMDESVGLESSELLKKSESARSFIPGYPLVSSDQNEVSTFVALVADMRKSSDHLLCDYKHAKVSMLQRVYYETSALLPALALTIGYENGAVTEYLGDGVLAFFKVDEENSSIAIRAAYRAARDSIGICRTLVNQELNNRYDLPSLDLGVGLACSPALITLVGLNGAKQAKAFGECVFRATKLSQGNNKIYVDAKLEAMWPTSNSIGGLKFRKKEINGVDGYLIE